MSLKLEPLVCRGKPSAPNLRLLHSTYLPGILFPVSGTFFRPIVVEADAHLAAVEVSAVAARSPVREFSWHPRQGNYPGWLWTATTGTLVGYESLLERDRVLLADFDVAVAGIASQPFWLSGLDEGVQRRHAPDHLLACADGSHGSSR